jgi:hypothetical protein
MTDRSLLVAVALLAACDREVRTRPSDGPSCDEPSGPGSVVAIRTLLFTRQVDGVTEGFDLDAGDDVCGVPDLVDAEGNPSVDNAFSYLLPSLELTEAAAVEGLVQQTISGGELVITLELRGPRDTCTDLVVGRAAGVPMLGTDGLILDGQTLDADPDTVPNVITGVTIADGHFEAPFEVVLPMQIFDVSLEFVIEDGRISGDIAPDGTVTGHFAGGVDVAALLEVAQSGNIDAGLHDILESLLDTWADLAPDDLGVCRQISLGFDFEAVPIFLYEEG